MRCAATNALVLPSMSRLYARGSAAAWGAVGLTWRRWLPELCSVLARCIGLFRFTKYNEQSRIESGEKGLSSPVLRTLTNARFDAVIL